MRDTADKLHRLKRLLKCQMFSGNLINLLRYFKGVSYVFLATHP